MALIEKECIPRKSSFTSGSTRKLIAMLDRYCIFIESSQNFVTERSLRFTLTKDRDFQTRLAAQGTTGGDGKGSSQRPAAGNP
jgi:hypothetical protein